MDVTRKDATITNTDDTEDAFPGSFEVILSAPTKDRDGDTLLPEEWKFPLPDHITFDADHGMSVASTVGSGTPSLDERGNLVVSGTYSSLPRAQEVRTLVNEGHIRTTSVAFMSEKSPMKDGKQSTVRELLNGAFVSIPSNREALVLSSKGASPTYIRELLEAGVKAGARHSATDRVHIQAIHDAALALGAAPADTTGAETAAVGGKSAEAVTKNPLDVPEETTPEADESVEAEALTSPEETTPEADGKSVDADALDLRYRVLSATLDAFTTAD